MSKPPLIDVIIAVHDPRRPVLRAIDSVLATGREDTRVTVVCHGISPGTIPGLMRNVAEAGPDRLRALEFHDGIPSPAGPFNHGINEATGTYISVMGSDDWLEAGALDAWAQHAQRTQPDVFLAGLRQQDGAPLRNPPVRPWRQDRLDAVRDRLFHRSAPLGLIRRTLLEEPPLRFSEGFSTGEDLLLSTILFGEGGRISVGFSAPRYVIGNDAPERVTSERHSMQTVLAPLGALHDSPRFQVLPSQVRVSALTARIRGGILANAAHRTEPGDWDQSGLTLIAQLLARSPEDTAQALAPLPRADRRMLDELATPDQTPHGAAAAAQRLRAAGRVDRLFPRMLRYSFHRESTPVRYLGYMLARLGNFR